MVLEVKFYFPAGAGGMNENKLKFFPLLILCFGLDIFIFFKVLVLILKDQRACHHQLEKRHSNQMKWTYPTSGQLSKSFPALDFSKRSSSLGLGDFGGSIEAVICFLMIAFGGFGWDFLDIFPPSHCRSSESRMLSSL